ncbi:MAG: nuclear transport factor 2 family protein, partial [Caulobacteraceae bacterium]
MTASESTAADIAERGARMDGLIRRYFDGCNEADTGKIAACFIPDAVHYFPPGMYEGPFRGAGKIAEKWRS